MDARSQSQLSGCVEALSVLAAQGHIIQPETQLAVLYNGPARLKNLACVPGSLAHVKSVVHETKV